MKNSNNALPLKSPKTLSIFGWDATSGLNTSSDAILFEFGATTAQTYIDGADYNDVSYYLIFGGIDPPDIHPPQIALNGTLLGGAGSGAITPSSSTSPYDAIQRQAALDGTTIYTDFVSQNPAVRASDTCLVFINAFSQEGADRSELSNAYSDTLVANVASKCANTIVIIHNAGIRIVDAVCNILVCILAA